MFLFLSDSKTSDKKNIHFSTFHLMAFQKRRALASTVNAIVYDQSFSVVGIKTWPTAGTVNYSANTKILSLNTTMRLSASRSHSAGRGNVCFYIVTHGRHLTSEVPPNGFNFSADVSESCCRLSSDHTNSFKHKHL